jgi:hypothetical protein
MADRFATVLVADEIYYNLHGKAILQGIYNADIGISSEEQRAQQLIFFFMVETDIQNPFRSLQVRVTLPGNDPVVSPVPILWPWPQGVPPDRVRMFIKWPLLIPSPVLRPGRIEAKAIHESGEISAAVPWIIGPQNSAAKISSN